MAMVVLSILGFFVLLALFAAAGWVADSRDHTSEPSRWFGSPYDKGTLKPNR
jgi:hypothetical protein